MAIVTEQQATMGVAPVCQALAIPRASYYRRRNRTERVPRVRRVPRALPPAERQHILAVLHDDRTETARAFPRTRCRCGHFWVSRHRAYVVEDDADALAALRYLDCSPGRALPSERACGSPLVSRRRQMGASILP